MSFFNWLDVASSVARLIGLMASPVFATLSVYHWQKGDLQKAGLFIGLAIYVRFGA